MFANMEKWTEIRRLIKAGTYMDGVRPGDWIGNRQEWFKDTPCNAIECTRLHYDNMPILKCCSPQPLEHTSSVDSSTKKRGGRDFSVKSEQRIHANGFQSGSDSFLEASCPGHRIAPARLTGSSCLALASPRAQRMRVKE